MAARSFRVVQIGEGGTTQFRWQDIETGETHLDVQGLGSAHGHAHAVATGQIFTQEFYEPIAPPSPPSHPESWESAWSVNDRILSMTPGTPQYERRMRRSNE